MYKGKGICRQGIHLQAFSQKGVYDAHFLMETASKF